MHLPRFNAFHAVVAFFLAEISVDSFAQAAMPWETNAPIVGVRKELCRQHPQRGVGVAAEQYLAGPNGRRIEISGVQAKDDVGTEVAVRFSDDNGRTWTAPQKIADTNIFYGDTEVFEASSCAVPFYDTRAGLLLQGWVRQIFQGKNRYCHTYYRLSRDFGRTWSAPKQLKYEAGPDFDPKDPLNPRHLTTNNGFIGVDVVRTSLGTLALGVCGVKAPSGGPEPGGELFGVVNFVGTWNGLAGAAADYTWQAGNRLVIESAYSPSFPTRPVSTRGLAECGTVVLKDGRILNLWRGSNRGLKSSAGKEAAGRKWISIASKDGLTFGPLQELKYDDGTSFFSPSSINRLFRHEGNGKLFLVGNISSTVPDGNRPRYPLVIAEVDENPVALKKNTVTVIEDRLPDQPSFIQFSNFSLLEDPETHQVELMLSNYGVDGTPLGGDSYKYTLTFVPEPW